MTITKLIEAKIVDIEKKIHPMIGNATWRTSEIKEILNQQLRQALQDIALASVEGVKVSDLEVISYGVKGEIFTIDSVGNNKWAIRRSGWCLNKKGQ